MSSMTVSDSSPWNVSGSSAATGVDGRHHGGAARLLDAAATALGMSAQDVLSSLQNGKSLDDLAADKGVSHDDLVSALEAALPQRLQNSGEAGAVAEQLATTKGLDALRPPRGAGGPQGPSGPPPPPPARGDGDDGSTGALGARLTESQQKTLGALASLLGTDASSLLDALKSGTSLSDLVTSRGIDSGALAGVVQDGLLYDAKA